jgi:hypothetical protein
MTEDSLSKVLDHVFSLCLLPFAVSFKPHVAVLVLFFITATIIFNKLTLALAMRDHHILSLGYFTAIPLFLATSIDRGARATDIMKIQWTVTSHLDSTGGIVNAS